MHIKKRKISLSLHLKELLEILSDDVLCQDMYDVSRNFFFPFKNKKQKHHPLA